MLEDQPLLWLSGSGEDAVLLGLLVLLWVLLSFQALRVVGGSGVRTGAPLLDGVLPAVHHVDLCPDKPAEPPRCAGEYGGRLHLCVVLRVLLALPGASRGRDKRVEPAGTVVEDAGSDGTGDGVPEVGRGRHERSVTVSPYRTVIRRFFPFLSLCFWVYRHMSVCKTIRLASNFRFAFAWCVFAEFFFFNALGQLLRLIYTQKKKR